MNIQIINFESPYSSRRTKLKGNSKVQSTTLD